MRIELNRVSSHLVWIATFGMDVGALSMMLYGFREREAILAFFEKTTGLRMNHNYIRPGGVAADLPDGWKGEIEALLELLPPQPLLPPLSFVPAAVLAVVACLR